MIKYNDLLNLDKTIAKELFLFIASIYKPALDFAAFCLLFSITSSSISFLRNFYYSF